MVGIGWQLFEAVRQIDAEDMVFKLAGSANRGGSSRDSLKAKVSETAAENLRTWLLSRGRLP